MTSTLICMRVSILVCPSILWYSQISNSFLITAPAQPLQTSCTQTSWNRRVGWNNPTSSFFSVYIIKHIDWLIVFNAYNDTFAHSQIDKW